MREIELRLSDMWLEVLQIGHAHPCKPASQPVRLSDTLLNNSVHVYGCHVVSTRCYIPNHFSMALHVAVVVLLLEHNRYIAMVLAMVVFKF